MTSSEANIAAVIDEAEVPKWKKELMVDRKTYARTITSASGNVKLTVTCPKAMRPNLKKPIPPPKKTTMLISNDEIVEKEKINSTVNKLNNSRLSEEQQSKLDLSHSIDEMDSNINGENFPKPGIVQSLRSKYLSMMNTEKPGIDKRSSSFENMLESKNPFIDEPRRKSLNLSTQENTVISNNFDDYPRPCTVSTTKKIFEASEKQVKYNSIYSNNNPFIKPAVMPKPIVKPRRIKPSIPLNKPVLSGRKTPTVKPFCNGVISPTSPVKSGRNLY